jgi:hypothetical protein
MAIQFNFSQVSDQGTIDVPLDPNYTDALENGMIMVWSSTVDDDGHATVTPCTGAADDEAIAGVLKLDTNSQASIPTIESDLTVPASSPFTLTLKNTPITLGTDDFEITVTVDGTRLKVNDDASPAADECRLVGDVLTFNSGAASMAAVVTYRYLNVPDQNARYFGSQGVNTGGARTFDTVTLYTGNIRPFISNFVIAPGGSNVVTAPEYVAGPPTPLFTGADGQVTTLTSTGTLIGSCIAEPKVLPSPGLYQAFIGCQLNIPG